MPNSGRSSIHRVAARRICPLRSLRHRRGLPLHAGRSLQVQEYGPNYSMITITLHAVPSGNYAYREISEDEFNRASR